MPYSSNRTPHCWQNLARGSFSSQPHSRQAVESTGSRCMNTAICLYRELPGDIKDRVIRAQQKAEFSQDLAEED